MKKTAQCLAIILLIFGVTLGGAEAGIKYLLIVLGIMVVIFLTIMILAEIDHRRHPPITTADLIEKINFETHQEIIESARRS